MVRFQNLFHISMIIALKKSYTSELNYKQIIHEFCIRSGKHSFLKVRGPMIRNNSSQTVMGKTGKKNDLLGRLTAYTFSLSPPAPAVFKCQCLPRGLTVLSCKLTLFFQFFRRHSLSLCCKPPRIQEYSGNF